MLLQAPCFSSNVAYASKSLLPLSSGRKPFLTKWHNSLKPTLFPLRLRSKIKASGVDEDVPTGNSISFEEGIFEEFQFYPSGNENHKGQKDQEKEKEKGGLIPEEWRELQRELNEPKKERKRRAKLMEVAEGKQKQKELQRRRDGLSESNTIKLAPLSFPERKTSLEVSEDSIADEDDNEEEDVEQAADYGQLHDTFGQKDEFAGAAKEGEDKIISISEKSDEVGDGNSGNVPRTKNRAIPKNPRLGLSSASLEEITRKFKEEDNDSDNENKEKERGQLYTAEEKLLLNSRIPDLKRATSEKWIPLHTFATAGESYLLDFLLSHGVDINAVDKNGLTALHKAVSCKKKGIINYILQAGADPHVQDKDGATLLHYAVEVGASQIIRLLLVHKVNINQPDNYGWTPLHLAVQSKRTDIVRLLLEKGANKRLKNKEGYSPLHLCLYAGRDPRTYELIRLLKTLPKRSRSQNHKLLQNLKL
eukprot:TRINITY_DN22650_c0_g1_i1.p1 TRINITY_DN22650_c0_g1~~TRINITY_DN22650_c0_g1_i1.p1  ORF type:complete len:477 (-),score=111.81 TRINITY_DN22650_c0_g1_i1:453-1883(-)